MNLEDRTINFSGVEDTKGTLTYTPQDADLAAKQGMQLHITVEQTVQYDGNDGVSGPSLQPWHPFESKHLEV